MMARPHQHSRALLISISALVLLAGCGPRRPGSVATPERTVIEVDNRAFTDMTVYVIEGVGARRRLGLANGASTTSFTIPASLVGNGRELTFLVDPIGSDRTALSNRIFVTPGQRVTLTIPPQ